MVEFEVTPANIPQLVAQLRSGDQDARRKLIEAFVGLAFKVADDYSDDEALSAALYCLVVSIDNFKVNDAPAEALVGYMHKSLRWACDDAVVRVGRCKNRHGKKCVPTDMAQSGNLFTEKHHRLRTNGDVPRIEQLDMVLGACEDDTDRQMVRLASMGHTQVQVASLVRTSEASVSRRMQGVEARFRVQERLLK